MRDSVVGRVLWRAVDDAGFRRRLLSNLGTSLAEEGFIVGDDDMATLRNCWDTIQNLGERAAYERIYAMARGYQRS